MRDSATEINLVSKDTKKSSTVLKQGWLKKQGGALGIYKNRWCVFTDDAIFKYYDSEDAKDENRKGKGDVSFKTIREHGQDGKNFYVTTYKKKWLFQAKDEIEAGDWLHSLRQPMGDVILDAIRPRLKKNQPSQALDPAAGFNDGATELKRAPEAHTVPFGDTQATEPAKPAELVVADENFSSREDVEIPVPTWKNKIVTEEEKSSSKISIEIEDDFERESTPIPKSNSPQVTTMQKTKPSFVPSPVKPTCCDFCCGNDSEVEARFLMSLPISAAISLLDVVLDIIVICTGWFEWQSYHSWHGLSYDYYPSNKITFLLSCVFVISGSFGFYNALVTNPTTMWFVKVASLFGMGSTAQALKIWIFGLNGMHHQVGESDIAIYESLKISEQCIRAPISGLLQISSYNLLTYRYSPFAPTEFASIVLCVISFASGVTFRKVADTKHYLAWQLKLMMFFYIASDYLLAANTLFILVFIIDEDRFSILPLLLISVPVFIASMCSYSWCEWRWMEGLQQALMSTFSISPLFDIYYRHAEIGYNNFAFICVWYRHILFASSGVVEIVFFLTFANETPVRMLILVLFTICFSAVFFIAFCDTIKAAYVVSLGTKKELSGSNKLKWQAFADSIGETFGRTPKVALTILSRYNKNKFPNRKNKFGAHDRAGYDDDLFIESELQSMTKVTNVHFLANVELDYSSHSKILCEQILTLDKKNPCAWKRLAELERETENFGAARANFEKCLEIDPNHSAAQRGIYDLDEMGV